MNNDSITEDTDLEYVIYCRKSTDESTDNQKQSIPDQLRACMSYVQKEWLTIKKKPSDFSLFESEKEIFKEENEEDINNRRIFQETKDLFIIKEQETGKIPWKRKKWTELIKMIRCGEIKWLISYSPDRQARNMLEGGELIDCVDNDQVTLKYPNFHFESNASGKMMLGIWFVFSKQYSDKLSEDVTRGSWSTIEAGQACWVYKPGYQIRKDGFHEPHPINFPLIQKAFEMKIDGWTDEDIANFINMSWYQREMQTSDRKTFMLWKKMGDVWKEEFYYGIHIRGSSQCDLRIMNPYYKPVISEEQFSILKERSEDTTRKNAKYKTKDEDLFDSQLKILDPHFVKSLDNYSFTFSVPNKYRFAKKIEDALSKNIHLEPKDVVGAHQIFYRCANKHSEYYNLSVSFEEIDRAIIEQMKRFRITKEDFQKYVEFANGKLLEISEKAQRSATSIHLDISRIRKERDEYIEKNMHIEKDKEEQRIYNEKRERFEKRIDFYTNQMSQLNTNERSEMAEIEAFIAIFQNAAKLYQKASNVQKGRIIEILFLNITVDDQKRLHLAIKPWLEWLFFWKFTNGG